MKRDLLLDNPFANDPIIGQGKLLLALVNIFYNVAIMLKRIAKWKTFVSEQFKFALNKAAYGWVSHIFHGSMAVTVDVGAKGILRQACVRKREKLLGRLEYFASADETGVLRGGHPASSYLHNLIADAGLDQRQKLRTVRQLIAQLPGDVLFGFCASPHANDMEILKKAFGGAGFQIWPQTTFNYSPPTDGSDIIASMRGSRMRTTLRTARKVLDVIELSPAEFVHFYAHNLETAGKENFCSPAIDLALLTEGVNRDPPQARIIAARMKSTPENPDPSRIESAIALTLGDDGLCKFFRITYRHDAYKHATKLLVLEACSIAVQYGKTIDTDAATEGGKIFYKRFGSFTEHTRYEFVRYPIRYRAQQVVPSLAKRLRLFAKPIPAVNGVEDVLYRSSQRTT